MKKNSVTTYAAIALVVIVLVIAVSTIARVSSKPQEEPKKEPEVVEKVERIINVKVYGKKNKVLFEEKYLTTEEKLVDQLNKIDELELETEESDYGAYITSIKGLKQSKSYYWAYYVDDEYATKGISECEIEDGKTYTFKYEKLQK